MEDRKSTNYPLLLLLLLQSLDLVRSDQISVVAVVLREGYGRDNQNQTIRSCDGDTSIATSCIHSELARIASHNTVN